MSLQKLHDEWSLANVDTHMKTIIGKRSQETVQEAKPVKIKNISLLPNMAKKTKFDEELSEHYDWQISEAKKRRRLNSWLSANNPEDGELYWISIPDDDEEDDNGKVKRRPRIETVGRFCKFGMDFGSNCFAILGSSNPVQWHSGVKILGKVGRGKR
jgi:hypothetical protein